MSEKSVEMSRKNAESVENVRADTEAAANVRPDAKSAKNIRGNAKTDAKSAKNVRADTEAVETVRIHTGFITLQDLLKLTGAVDTGGEAKIRIQNCEALVNGAVCVQRGKKLRPGDAVTFRGKSYVVGHGE